MALAKSNGNLFAIALKSEKEPSKKKQRTDTKKNAKRIKSDTRSNREKSNIAIAILEKLIIRWHHNYFVFWW